MIEDKKHSSGGINYYWIKTGKVYSSYPTVRHRYRFVINSIKNYKKGYPFSFYDYGTGNGDLLLKVKNTFTLDDDMLGGSEISEVGFELTKEKINSNNLYNLKNPKLSTKFDVMACIEVIEHTEKYLEIISWIKENLSDKGLLILSTQSGPMYNSDKYVEHTQHFELKDLETILKENGFKIKYSTQWGFPFFTIQKVLTNINFNFTKDRFLEGKLSLAKKLFYDFSYLLYYLHDFINYGPQIYIVAEKI